MAQTKLGELLREQFANAEKQGVKQSNNYLSAEEEDTIRKVYRDRIKQTPAYKNTEATLSRLTGDEAGVIGYKQPGFFGRIFGKKPEPVEVGEEPKEVSRAQIEGMKPLNVEELTHIGVFRKWEHTNYQYPVVNLLVGPEGGIFVANSNPDKPSHCTLKQIKLTHEELDKALEENAGGQVRGVNNYIGAIHKQRELTHSKETLKRAQERMNEDNEVASEQFGANLKKDFEGDNEITPSKEEKELVELLNHIRAETYTDDPERDIDPKAYERIEEIKKELGLSFVTSHLIHMDEREHGDFKNNIAKVHELPSGAKLVRFRELSETLIPSHDDEAYNMLVSNVEEADIAQRMFGHRLENFRPDKGELNDEHARLSEELEDVNFLINHRSGEISGNAEIAEIVNRHTGQGDDTPGERGNLGPER